jgi:hypothetical protein
MNAMITEETWNRKVKVMNTYSLSKHLAPECRSLQMLSTAGGVVSTLPG